VKERLEALIEEMLKRGIRLDEALEEFEKRFLHTALARTAGNQCKAAELLHIHRNTLARKSFSTGLTAGGKIFVP